MQMRSSSFLTMIACNSVLNAIGAGATDRNEIAEDVPFDLSDESDGTRKLFEFIGGWLRALTIGAILFVDELDRSLHPYITRFLVTLFHGSKNTKNAQLIFTTHDTTLLDYRRARMKALERGYMKGRYGAVPTLGKLSG
jgi:AAA15 family ATPase/GTPase